MFIIVMSEISAFCQISTAKCTQTLTESLAGFVKNVNGVVTAVVIWEQKQGKDFMQKQCF